MHRPDTGRFHDLVQPSPATAQAATARAAVRALLGGDVLGLQELVHPDVVHHGGESAGWAGVRELALTACATIPESCVELVCSEGDTAVCRVLASVGRVGWGDVLHRTALVVLRFQDDLVSELWFPADFTSPEYAVA
jgi:hypothetical protein